ncbi:putative disease resistance protein RGA3 [Bienertia sinuspersici]
MDVAVVLTIVETVLKLLKDAVYDADDLFDEVATVSPLKQHMPYNKLSKEDKRTVINMLLHTVVEDNVSIVSIVGIGGLGKTALAKLVYNDDTIRTEFSPKMWIGVSDGFDVKSLLGQILAAATSRIVNSGLDKNQLQTKLRQQLNGKKFLLVLDDVWNEDSTKWIELRNILIQGGRDSRIIVTTRSKWVANVVGSHWTHELQGLSDDDSWMLFQKMTLMEPQLVEIGKEIIRKCFSVPLAIRFVASLLQGQVESTWRNLKSTNLANIKRDDKEGILPVLKISNVKNNVGCLGADDVGKLEDLKHLDSLSDYIQIEMKNGWTYDAEKNDEPSHDDEEDAEALLQGLQPHHNIKILRLYGYPGVRFPGLRIQSSMNLNMNAPLPNLVHIRLCSCEKLEQLPLLSQLLHLKELRLRDLKKLEYMESKRSGHELVFFPSFAKHKLKNLPKLKGWWKKSTSTLGDGDQSNKNNEKQLQGEEDLLLGRLSSLQALEIIGFSNLKSINGRVWEHFTALETLKLRNLPELELEEEEKSINSKEEREEKEDNGNDAAMHMHMHMPWIWVAPTLCKLELCELPKMVRLPKGTQHLTALRHLEINVCDNLEEIPAWIHCFSSLQQLEMSTCSKVKSLPKEMRHLTCLTHLTLNKCSLELKERCEEPTGVDWPKIQHIPIKYVDEELNYYCKHISYF